jgi:hypothetical protein
MLARKQELAWVLTLSFPTFPLTYFLACAKAISPAWTIVIYLVFSLLTKGVFASITMVYR